MNRATLAKSIVINCDLRAGERISEEMLEVKSPGRGLQPNKKAALIGKIAKRPFKKGDYFFASDITEDAIGPRSYSFLRKWGIAVRWHDFKTLSSRSNPDFLEFHLSFKDMDVDYMRLFEATSKLGLVVHSPDVFTGDHLLDLANPSAEHRERSIYELQRVVNLTRDLKRIFKGSERPLVVASLGGFSESGFLGEQERRRRYKILKASLERIDAEGVEIIGQTLPPFPWYFGGQLYLNLFVTPADTAEFCNSEALRLCYDVCHAKLACNHYRISFSEYTERVAPYVAHLHLADARGVDGEGIQINEGDIDFPGLLAQLDFGCPDASFIPEIWQGHKDEGAAFWVALQRLEVMLQGTRCTPSKPAGFETCAERLI